MLVQAALEDVQSDLLSSVLVSQIITYRVEENAVRLHASGNEISKREVTEEEGALQHSAGGFVSVVVLNEDFSHSKFIIGSKSRVIVHFLEELGLSICDVEYLFLLSLESSA